LLTEILCPLLKVASISNFNPVMQFRPCYKTLKNPTINLKRQNSRQKPFPAKNFIQINHTFAIGSKKLSISLRACIHVCNFCTHFNCVYGGGLIGAFVKNLAKNRGKTGIFAEGDVEIKVTGQQN